MTATSYCRSVQTLSGTLSCLSLRHDSKLRWWSHTHQICTWTPSCRIASVLQPDRLSTVAAHWESHDAAQLPPYEPVHKLCSL